MAGVQSDDGSSLRVPALETPRLILEPLEARHEADVGRLFADEASLWDFRASRLTPPSGGEAIARNVERYARDGFGHCAVRCKDDGAFVGLAGLIVQSIDDAEELEVGYRLLSRFWKRGFATEAARAWIEHGFRVTSRARIIAIIRTDNDPSIRVATRLGMTLATTTTWSRVPDPVHVFAKPRPG
jgi:RimJ/RimL family protein N-acetyltransferase